MAYDEDLRALARLEKLRLAARILALVLLVAAIALEVAWLYYAEAAAWATSGVVSLLEARVLRRLGRDPDMAYLWAVAAFVCAVLCLF